MTLNPDIRVASRARAARSEGIGIASGVRRACSLRLPGSRLRLGVQRDVRPGAGLAHSPTGGHLGPKSSTVSILNGTPRGRRDLLPHLRKTFLSIALARGSYFPRSGSSSTADTPAHGTESRERRLLRGLFQSSMPSLLLGALH